MLFFHAFTGCDVASAFRNKEKKTAWHTWDIFPEASPVFSKLSQYPLTVEQSGMDILERFVILMYDRSSTATTVDEARLDLFARNSDHMRRSLQPKLLSSSTPSVLPTRQVVCGARQPCVSLK